MIDKPLQAMTLTELRERFRPEDEPFRKEWDLLHQIHVALLMAENDVCLLEAVKVADQKHYIYVAWSQWRETQALENR